MKIKGVAHKFGDDINTDEIIPARYLNSTDPEELGRHCMEGKNKDFSRLVNKGDIIVAGKNFGCGSSREHAQLAIKGCGVSCVVAVSFARIFYRNAINVGLPILECHRSGKIDGGDKLQIDLTSGDIYNATKDVHYSSRPLPAFMQEIVTCGGLLRWIRKTSHIK